MLKRNHNVRKTVSTGWLGWRLAVLAIALALVGPGTVLLAYAPQAPQMDLPNYGNTLSFNQEPSSPQTANEVRVDPFVTPASSLSLPTSNAPRELTTSEKSSGPIDQSLQLKPRSSAAIATEDGETKPRASSFGSVLTMFTSLLVVITLFFAFIFMLKKANGGNASELPADVFQVLGTSRLAGRHSLFLLRLGQKLVLVHAGSGEVQAITEVTDPIEVDRLCGSCEENQPNSISQSFKQVLKNVTEGGNGKRKSFSENLRFRNKSKEEIDEVSPAVALLAKEKP